MIRCVLLCMLEAMRCVLLCILEAVEGRLCLLEVLEMAEVSEVMRCVLLCTLEVVEGGLCLLEVPEGLRRVLVCIFRSLAFVPQGSLGKPRAAVSSPILAAHHSEVLGHSEEEVWRCAAGV